MRILTTQKAERDFEAANCVHALIRSSCCPAESLPAILAVLMLCVPGILSVDGPAGEDPEEQTQFEKQDCVLGM